MHLQRDSRGAGERNTDGFRCERPGRGGHLVGKARRTYGFRGGKRITERRVRLLNRCEDVKEKPPCKSTEFRKKIENSYSTSMVSLILRD
jgi:hypothetical protein